MNPCGVSMSIQLRFDFDSTHKEELLRYFGYIVGHPKWLRTKAKETATIDPSSKEYLKSVYDIGYGLKVIARELDMSYTKVRYLFKYLKLDIRHGHDVSTSVTCDFRRKMAYCDGNVFRDWTTREWASKNTGVGHWGYYKRADGLILRMRSTWEYIYAKWLDTHNIHWEYEITKYVLPNGEGYTPDFFIYDGNDLSYIVEIKGWRSSNRHKPKELETMLGIGCVIIADIKPYSTLDIRREIRTWKATRRILHEDYERQGR